MSAHSTLSPSGAETWFNCPGSVQAQSGLPESDTVYSAEGTAAHRIRSECLELGLDPSDFLGQTLKVGKYSFVVDDDWVRYLQPGIDRCREWADDYVIETKVDLSRWLGPDQAGTLDYGAWTSELIIVDDLKFGAGEPVHPERNKQAMLYALGFWDQIARHHTKATEFLISIDQPRADGGGGEWRVSLEELLAFGEEARKCATATRDKNAPRVASLKGCRWCKARGKCAALAAFNLELMSAKFDDLDNGELKTPKIGDLTPARRAEIWRHEGMIRGWLEDLHTMLLADALAGRPTPGFVAALGRKGNRVWTKPEEVAEFLMKRMRHHQVYDYKLISPTQAEKTVGPTVYKKLKKWIDQADPKPALVADDGKHEAIKTVTRVFDDLDSLDADDLV